MAKYSFTQLQQLWKDAGGNAAAALMAAAVAMAESGGDSSATHTNNNGTVDRGLWQINSIHGAQSTTDPTANARAAVQISGNGQNWRPWCTAWSDGACGGTFLGAGAPYEKYMNGGVVQNIQPINGTPVNNAGLTDLASPEKWAQVFLRPMAVWGLYGMMTLAGTVFVVVGVVLIGYNTPPTKFFREVVTGAAKSYIKNQVGGVVKGVKAKGKGTPEKAAPTKKTPEKKPPAEKKPAGEKKTAAKKTPAKKEAATESDES